jgi:hypothetical protein
MHRKTSGEPCEQLRKFNPGELKRKCLGSVLDHAAGIAAAEPEIPRDLNDRAADQTECEEDRHGLDVCVSAGYEGIRCLELFDIL